MKFLLLCSLLSVHRVLRLFAECWFPSEIFRVSGMLSNQGFSDFDRLRYRSPSPMASSNLMSNVSVPGLGGWNGLPQEVKFYTWTKSFKSFNHASSVGFLFPIWMWLSLQKLAILSSLHFNSKLSPIRQSVLWHILDFFCGITCNRSMLVLTLWLLDYNCCFGERINEESNKSSHSVLVILWMTFLPEVLNNLL